MSKNKRLFIQNDPNGDILEKLWSSLELSYASCRRTTAPKNITMFYRVNFMVDKGLKLRSDFRSHEVSIYHNSTIYVTITLNQAIFSGELPELENLIRKVIG